MPAAGILCAISLEHFPEIFGKLIKQFRFEWQSK